MLAAKGALERLATLRVHALPVTLGLAWFNAVVCGSSAVCSILMKFLSYQHSAQRVPES